MTHTPTTPPTPRKKRRTLHWILAAIVVLLVVAFLIPFVFTTQIARAYLARSAYAKFHPTLDSARLGIGGVLTLEGLTLHETDRSAPLLHAAQLQATFSWTQIYTNRINTVAVTGLVVHARGTTQSPLTLTNLGEADSGGGPPIWITSLIASGAVKLARPAGTAFTNELPLTITLETTGPRATPEYRARATLGNNAAATLTYQPVTGAVPELRIETTALPASLLAALLPPRYADVHVFDVYALTATLTRNNATSPWQANATLTPDGPASRTPQKGTLAARVRENSDHTLQIESLTLHDFTVTLSPQTLRALAPDAPDLTATPLTITLPDATLTGLLDLQKPHFTGDIDLQSLSLANSGDANSRIALRAATVVATIDTPLDERAIRQAEIRAAAARFASATHGNSTVSSASADLTLDHGRLVFKSLDLAYAGGRVTGRLAYNLRDNRLASVNLSVEHLDAHTLAAAATDKIDAQGALTGTVKFMLDDEGLPKGSMDLAADGPGKLLIQDESVARELAEALPKNVEVPLTQEDLGKIIVGQLRNYPFNTAHVTVTAPRGRLELKIDVKRKPLEAGEPGFNVDVQVGGKTMKGNVPVNLSGLTITLPNQSLESLVGLLTGFQSLANPRPAESPAKSP